MVWLQDWEINGIDRSGLDAQVAEGKLLACCICWLVLCSAYSANLVQIATPRTPRPALVLTPVTADEVRAYVVCCRNHGLTVRARSGGHNYEGLSYRSLRSSGDGEEAARFAVVDVAALQAVRVDAARGVARTKAGATRAVCRIGAAGLPPPPPVLRKQILEGCTSLHQRPFRILRRRRDFLFRRPSAQ
jgi:hypothetical protein